MAHFSNLMKQMPETTQINYSTAKNCRDRPIPTHNLAFLQVPYILLEGFLFCAHMNMYSGSYLNRRFIEITETQSDVKLLVQLLKQEMFASHCSSSNPEHSSTLNIFFSLSLNKQTNNKPINSMFSIIAWMGKYQA